MNKQVSASQLLQVQDLQLPHKCHSAGTCGALACRPGQAGGEPAGLPSRHRGWGEEAHNIMRFFTSFRMTNALCTLLFALCTNLFSCAILGIIKDRLPEPHRVRGGYLFQLEAESAKIVYLAGDFNSWQKPPDVKGITLTKDPETGVWKTVADLKPGRYQYKFVIDNNTWIMDPNNPASVDDGKGNVNSLIIVR